MGAGGKAQTLTGWPMGCVPRIRVLSVTWGLLSSVVLTRYMRSLIGVEDMVFGESFYDSVQCAGGGEARLSGMSGNSLHTSTRGLTECSDRLASNNSRFGSLFNQGRGGAA